MKIEEWRKTKSSIAHRNYVNRTLQHQDDVINFVNPGERRYPGCSTYKDPTLGKVGSANDAYLVAANTLDFWKAESLRGGESSGVQSTYFLPRGPHEIGPCREGCHCCEACSGRRDLDLLGEVLLAVRALGVDLSFGDMLKLLRHRTTTNYSRAMSGCGSPPGQEVKYRPNADQKVHFSARMNKKNHQICLNIAHGTPNRCPELTKVKESNKTLPLANISAGITFSECAEPRMYPKQSVRQLGKMCCDEIFEKYSELKERRCILLKTTALEKLANLVEPIFYLIFVIIFLGNEFVN